MKLMDEIDSYIPDPERALDKPFQMSVEDVFTIQGRGTVVTGRVEQGIIKVGQEVEVVGMGANIKTAGTGTWCSVMGLRPSDISPFRDSCSCALYWVDH